MIVIQNLGGGDARGNQSDRARAGIQEVGGGNASRAEGLTNTLSLDNVAMRSDMYLILLLERLSFCILLKVWKRSDISSSLLFDASIDRTYTAISKAGEGNCLSPSSRSDTTPVVRHVRERAAAEGSRVLRWPCVLPHLRFNQPQNIFTCECLYHRCC